MTQFVTAHDTRMIYSGLVPRGVRRNGAGDFVAPWDLSTPPGVLRSHGTTRRRFFFPEQAQVIYRTKSLRARTALPICYCIPRKKNRVKNVI